MTEKRVIKVSRAALQEFRKLQQQNELLRQRVSYQKESIAALRDVIQTFQAEANYKGVVYKQGTGEIVKEISK